MSAVLTPAELQRLTNRRRSDAQRRVLDRMGVRYAQRPDKTLAVLQSQVEAALGAGASTIRVKEPELRL